MALLKEDLRKFNAQKAVAKEGMKQAQRTCDSALKWKHYPDFWGSHDNLRTVHLAIAWFRGRTPIEAERNHSKHHEDYNTRKMQRAALHLVGYTLERARKMHEIELKAKIRAEKNHTMISVPIVMKSRPYVCENDDTRYYHVNTEAPDVAAFLQGHDEDVVQAFVRVIMPDDLESLINFDPESFYNVPPGIYIWRGSAVIDEDGIECMVDSFTPQPAFETTFHEVMDGGIGNPKAVARLVLNHKEDNDATEDNNDLERGDV
jgi:hypothetical protein